MRATDQAPPVLIGDRPPRPPTHRADLFVGIERVPVYAIAWDDYSAAWDGAGELGGQWDDPEAGAGWIDATCSVSGLELELGAPDVEGRLEAGHALVTLDNRTGEWSQYDTFGRLVAYEPGSRVAVWAEHGGAAWWLFAGVVTAWRERPDATVEVEAFDSTSLLAADVGTWRAGAAGDRAEVRLAAILDLYAAGARRRFDPGTVTLHRPDTTNSPLEECQAVATSDGGYFGADADGTLIYRNRQWAGGRPDQTAIMRFTDNVCGMAVVARELELTTDDETAATTVRLENLEGLAGTAVVSGPDRRFPITRTGDLWRTKVEGDQLAAALLERRLATYLRVQGFTLLLHDPLQDLWRAGLDLRVGDLVRFVRDQVALEGVDRLDLNLVVTAVRHAITPLEWRVEVATSKAVGNNITWRWGGVATYWDTPPAVWSN